MKIKFAVFKLDDVDKYTPFTGRGKLEHVAEAIELGRLRDGKTAFNEYLVINRDEPYVGEVIEIMKRHGHWDEPHIDVRV